MTKKLTRKELPPSVTQLDRLQQSQLAQQNESIDDSTATTSKKTKKPRPTPDLRGPRAKVHPCPRCHKSFDRPISLNHHMRTHTAHKPEVCQGCKRRFATPSNLYRHERTCSHATKLLPPSSATSASTSSSNAETSIPSSSLNANQYSDSRYTRSSSLPSHSFPLHNTTSTSSHDTVEYPRTRSSARQQHSRTQSDSFVSSLAAYSDSSDSSNSTIIAKRTSSPSHSKDSKYSSAENTSGVVGSFNTASRTDFSPTQSPSLSSSSSSFHPDQVTESPVSYTTPSPSPSQYHDLHSQPRTFTIDENYFPSRAYGRTSSNDSGSGFGHHDTIAPHSVQDHRPYAYETVSPSEVNTLAASTSSTVPLPSPYPSRINTTPSDHHSNYTNSYHPYSSLSLPLPSLSSSIPSHSHEPVSYPSGTTSAAGYAPGPSRRGHHRSTSMSTSAIASHAVNVRHQPYSRTLSMNEREGDGSDETDTASVGLRGTSRSKLIMKGGSATSGHMRSYSPSPLPWSQDVAITSGIERMSTLFSRRGAVSAGPSPSAISYPAPGTGPSMRSTSTSASYSMGRTISPPSGIRRWEQSYTSSQSPLSLEFSARFHPTDTNSPGDNAGAHDDMYASNSS